MTESHVDCRPSPIPWRTARLRRKRSLGENRQICRVLIRKLSLNFCCGMAHRDPKRSQGREAPDPACHFSPSICSITAARPLGYMARRQFQDADAGRVSHSSAADDRDRRQDSGTFAWSVRSGHARVNLIMGSWWQCYGCHPEHHRIWPIGYSRSRQQRGACQDIDAGKSGEVTFEYPDDLCPRRKYSDLQNLNLTRLSGGSQKFYSRNRLNRGIIPE
jgi:hypothetical protein